MVLLQGVSELIHAESLEGCLHIMTQAIIIMFEYALKAHKKAFVKHQRNKF